ncbi:hypothetical protein GLOIN_2v1626493 [Rhizophagus irregularis DAOM 181602=DAOM 197198]|uniref:Uncharacterized protein n=1 Tax=Rhizophagus irregularis (strain DAOM 181602 / DAOM 197198 / MUCL 43194) TaxID=747089 RepID=A0A2P4PVX0_RHIID|nr:hypothetical protein GLOIN_2v1626493 [Rhizophagus irregularis DAOM 181602=DAOM 197198]POG69520.1 hypothetical protein GLOIN_2v1626493 [Rhizophagus irregularis DAOM 181602=DAOM 197198]|eukprot:XP_025176386.1 hypothetical protein GLOIN_2v1626493 [Rhizophagus irregularis DAOM 181602=DAOM 197198]
MKNIARNSSNVPRDMLKLDKKFYLFRAPQSSKTSNMRCLLSTRNIRPIPGQINSNKNMIYHLQNLQ